MPRHKFCESNNKEKKKVRRGRRDTFTYSYRSMSTFSLELSPVLHTASNYLSLFLSLSLSRHTVARSLSLAHREGGSLCSVFLLPSLTLPFFSCVARFLTPPQRKKEREGEGGRRREKEGGRESEGRVWSFMTMHQAQKL